MAGSSLLSIVLGWIGFAGAMPREVRLSVLCSCRGRRSRDESRLYGGCCGLCEGFAEVEGDGGEYVAEDDDGDGVDLEEDEEYGADEDCDDADFVVFPVEGFEFECEEGDF